MGNDKLTPKRHIGPAMRWAKPKTNNGQSAAHRDRKIKIELADAADDPESTDVTNPRRDSGDDKRGGTTRASDGDDRLRTRSISAEPAGSNTADPWWRRGVEHAEELGSAWTEYASSRNREAEATFSGSEQRLDDTFTTYSYGSEQFKASSAQHNTSIFDGAPSSSPPADRAVWPQYLLPVAVVAFIIFLAFMTLVI